MNHPDAPNTWTRARQQAVAAHGRGRRPLTSGDTTAEQPSDQLDLFGADDQEDTER
jgi:hypothetical protein